MKTLLMSVAAVAAVAAGPAVAADIPVAPRPVVLNWTGCHIGAVVGLKRGEDERWFYGTNTLTALGAPAGGVPASGQFDVNGFLAGGTLGCDYQTGTWVFGVEGDWAWTSAHNKTAESLFRNSILLFEQNWLATARGRIGFAMWDRAMLYFTGGGAWAQAKGAIEVGVAGPQTNPPTTIRTDLGIVSQDFTRSGWTIGAGYEALLFPNVSFKMEYLFVDLGTPSFFSLFDPIAHTQLHVRLREHVFRMGVNYRFGWTDTVRASY
jgi:outer membrane immunogenic protein